MLARKIENTYLVEAPIQALAGQIFNSNKTVVQGMAHAHPRCALPSCMPYLCFTQNVCLVCVWALQLDVVQYDSLELGLVRQSKRPDS